MKIAGDTLRLWRTLKKYNQQGLAKKLGITQQDYSKWERKEYINGEQLQRFLNVCHCTLRELEEIQRLTPSSGKI